MRVSAELSAKSEPEYRGPVCQNWSGGESVPVPGRTEATVGPSLSPGGMYTVAKGPTALLQKTRRGESDLQKKTVKGGKERAKRFP